MTDLPLTPALCAVQCPHGHTHTCARSPKHCGPHRDVKQKGDESCSWIEGESVTTVHAATPEGITPCGLGTRDVTTDGLIAEITCVGCLQALALEKGAQVIEMRDERDQALRDAREMPALADRVAAIEEQLSPPEMRGAVAPERPAPARYRDRTGDMWEDQGDGTLTTIAVHRNRPRDLGITLDRATIERQYGPLTPVTNNTAEGDA